ncbi:hypothetical protein B0H13DRAFT_2141829, partial [Mycena leptocephala]
MSSMLLVRLSKHRDQGRGRRISGLTSKPRSPRLLRRRPSNLTHSAHYLLHRPPQRALAVQILLVVPPPGGGTALVHKASGTRVEPEPRFVLLEEWVLAFAASSVSATSTSGASTSSASTSPSASDTTTSRSSSTDDESSADVLPPTIYKNAIPLFRALYALLRILPAWRVVRKLTSRRAPLGAGGGPQAQGKRGLRVVVRLRPESGEGMRMGG